jgi:hypothetical protein
MDEAYERRLMLAIRAHEYDRRTARMQALTREGLEVALDEAAARVRLDRGAWRSSGVGGESLTVLPAGTPETTIVDRFVRQLHSAMRERNRLVPPQGRLRLGLAIHFGLVARAGEADGPGVIVARSLAGCDPLLEHLSATTADMVVIVSRPVYDDTIAAQLTSLEAEDLREVDAQGEKAWMWSLGAGAPAPRPSRPADTQISTFAQAPIHAPHGQIAGLNIYNNGVKE